MLMMLLSIDVHQDMTVCVAHHSSSSSIRLHSRRTISNRNFAFGPALSGIVIASSTLGRRTFRKGRSRVLQNESHSAPDQSSKVTIMPSSGVVSKKLKFKGEPSAKSSSKKRSREEQKPEQADDAGTDNSWIFPSNADEINGPCFIVLPVPSPPSTSTPRVKKEEGQDQDVAAADSLEYQDICCLSVSGAWQACIAWCQRGRPVLTLFSSRFLHARPSSPTPPSSGTPSANEFKPHLSPSSISAFRQTITKHLVCLN